MGFLRNTVLGLAALAMGTMQAVDLQAQFRRPSIGDAAIFDAGEQTQLRDLMMGYINQTIVDDHANNAGTIHCENTLFLTWHREYIEKLEAWLMTQDWGSKYVPLPKWRPDIDAIPNAFFNNGSVFGGYPALVTQDITNLATNNNPLGNYNLVQYITPSVCSNYPAGNEFRACTGFSFGTALDNFARALEGDHNWVHDNVGGVMSDPANSPAAAIFFLWHGDVDDYYRYYQCQCSGLQQKNLFMKDNPADIGGEPNTTVTNNVYWESPDIWVRQNQDPAVGTGFLNQDRLARHQNPEYKAVGNNYVYVRVRNIGCVATTATDVKLRVYWSKWSPGVWQWPTDWTTLPQGSEITTAPGISVPAMQPGEVRVIEVPWVVPDPALYPNDPSHFCLLARLISVADPMAVVEGPDVWTNTRNNNNIAWRNVRVYDNDPFNIIAHGGCTKFFVGATRPLQTDAKIKFDFVANPTLRVTVDLGTDLYQVWQNGGALGTGITPIGGTQIRINQPGAVIRGLALPTATVYRPCIEAYMQALPTGGLPHVNYGDIAPVRVLQYEDDHLGNDVLTGGITYEINNKESAIYSPTLINNLTITQPTCPETSDGSITVNVASVVGQTYTYWWSTGASTQTVNGLAPGTYRVVVRRSDNVVQEKIIALTTASTLKTEVNSTSTHCGQADGSATVFATGGSTPYTYQWYLGNGTPITGATLSTLSNVTNGLYKVRVTDAAGCIINTKINVLQEMSMLQVFMQATDATSPTSANGTAEANPVGMGPFTYLWNTSATTKKITGLLPGTYTVTVTDAMGCSKIDQVEVSYPGSRALQGVEKDGESGESLMKILSVVPNPVTDRAELNFTLVEPGTVRVEIYDELGKLVKFVEEASRLGGTNSVRIDTRTLASGRYSLRLAIGNRAVSTPLVVVR